MLNFFMLFITQNNKHSHLVCVFFFTFFKLSLDEYLILMQNNLLGFLISWLAFSWTSQVVLMVKDPPANAET